MGEMDAYKDAFLAESADYLMQITEGLLALESKPDDLEPVEVVFRGAHSLKGMSAAMNYQRTADLTHKMEGLMDRVRKQELPVSLGLVNLMLGALDLVRDLIDDESGGKSDVDPAEMIAALEEMTHSDSVAVAVEAPAEVAGADSPSGAVGTSGGTTLVTVTLEPSCVLKAVRAYMVIKRLSHIGEVVETHPSAREIEDESFDRTFEIVLATSQPVEAVRQAAAHVSEVAEVKVETCAPGDESPQDHVEEQPLAGQVRRDRQLPKLSQTQTVRVSIGHLDTLVDLVGELVILRSRLERIAGNRFDSELSETVDELQRISTELQYEVMQTRMVPVGNIFNRFPRMVRDLAIDLGKRVDFKMSGLEIELDRTVLDEIGDPLVHLLRNSIDHGVEDAEQRRALGKPEIGTVTLSASRERDHVAIIVSDDGKGIDPEKVWRKAVQRGLVEEADRYEYDTNDILLLTCVPSFSTVDKATKISGRGVGMDVVKGKIEHLGGTVQIRSTVGVGTDFVLRLPLTLAIVQALLVETRGQMFALPLSAVDEVVLTEEVTVDTVDGAPVVIWRDGAVVPLHRLDAILFGSDPRQMPEPRSSIVLVQSGTEQHALNVDSLGGRLEVVIKPLSRLLKDSRGFSGATILGDGRVMLILDPRTVFTATEA